MRFSLNLVCLRVVCGMWSLAGPCTVRPSLDISLRVSGVGIHHSPVWVRCDEDYAWFEFLQ